MSGLFYMYDILLAAAVIFSFVLPAFLVLRTVQLKKSAVFSDEFFKFADKLIEDEETPELVISYLETMARIINEPEFSRRILSFALTGKLRDTTNKPSARSEEFLLVINGMRKELKDLLVRASVSCMLSATYKSPFFGEVVRRMTLFSIERDQKQVEIVASNIFSNGLGSGHAHA